MTLNQKRFSFEDFVQGDPNNPEAVSTFITRFELEVPIYVGGEISSRIDQAEKAVGAADDTTTWVSDSASMAAAEAWIQLAQARENVNLLERALETVDWMSSEWPADPVRQVSEELYLAPASKLLELIRKTQSAHATLLIVGHNPGMSELALRLAGSGDPQARRRMAGGFPPCACAELVFARPAWSAIGHGQGALDGYWTPGAAEA